MTLVASLRAIGRRPEASGSSVPAWPILGRLRIRRTRWMAWLEERPTGLSRRRKALGGIVGAFYLNKIYHLYCILVPLLVMYLSMTDLATLEFSEELAAAYALFRESKQIIHDQAYDFDEFGYRTEQKQCQYTALQQFASSIYA